MAGSFGHVDPNDGGKWSFIENMGDAYECVEELLYLVMYLGDQQEIAEALAVFYAFKRGEMDPNETRVTAFGDFRSDFGEAYLKTQSVMEQ